MRKIFWLFINRLNAILPKMNNVVLLYSGVEYKDNIKAIGDYLFENKYDQRNHIVLAFYQRKYNHVLIAGKKRKIYGKIVGILTFLFAKKVLYAFNALPINPSKNQLVLQMWHGMPLKCIFNANSSVPVKYDYFSYIIATSPFFADIISKSVPCSINRVVILGQPKVDSMFLREKKNSNIKHVFWAPTFRKAKYWNQNDAEMKSIIPLIPDEKIVELNDFLESLGIELIVKLHPMESCEDNFIIERGFVKVYSHNMFTQKGYELYDFLGQSDALITDYSSTFFDYLLLNRPIAFVVENMSDYSKKRGFVFDSPQDYMPGNIITTYDNLKKFLESISRGGDQFKNERNRLGKLFNGGFGNFHNCQKILDFMNIR